MGYIHFPMHTTVHTNEVQENRISGIFFLELFSDSFFSQKTEILLWRVSVVCYDFSFDSVFFHVSEQILSKIFKS